MASVPEAASRFISFVNASPTTFHAVFNAAARLEKAGFRKIREQDVWEKELKAGGRYYFTRDQASLLAFTIPKGWEPGTGVSIVATHVDSPHLRVRPISKRSESGYLQVGVETYGGGIWHTWLDRDLSLAGRVIVATGDGAFVSRLVNVARPVLHIPSLAIHLDRTVNTTFEFNQETQFVPILALADAQLNADVDGSKAAKPRPKASNHHPELISLLATELSVAQDAIRDFDLCLYDTQPATLGGLNNEFIFSARLDNLISSFCAVEALAESTSTASSLVPTGNVNCISLFNHEEIGSISSTGARSDLLQSFLQRLSPTATAYSQCVARSFIVSSDATHALHPSYTAKHEMNHKPKMNGGIVVKSSAKQRYATSATGSFIIKELVCRRGGQVQEYEARNDMTSGSTVGPFLSLIGIRTVDVGNAILSMHSIRETAGSRDVQHAIDLFRSLFEGFREVDVALSVD